MEEEMFEGEVGGEGEFGCEIGEVGVGGEEVGEDFGG